MEGAGVETEVKEPPQDPVMGSDDGAEVAAVAAPEVLAGSLPEYLQIWWRRIRGGESGALPVTIGLVGIVLYFQLRNSLFLSAGNLVNLVIQGAPIILFGMAEV